MDDKLALRPAEGAKLISISRSKMYQLLATKEIPSIRVGSSLRIPVAALVEWINRKTA